MSHGVNPAARSSAMAAATGPPRRRKRSSEGRTRNVSAGKPSTSSPRAIEKWAWSETYARTPSRAEPRGGSERPSSLANPMSRATVRAMRLAITPPEVRTPKLSGP